MGFQDTLKTIRDSALAEAIRSNRVTERIRFFEELAKPVLTAYLFKALAAEVSPLLVGAARASNLYSYSAVLAAIRRPATVSHDAFPHVVIYGMGYDPNKHSLHTLHASGYLSNWEPAEHGSRGGEPPAVKIGKAIPINWAKFDDKLFLSLVQDGWKHFGDAIAAAGKNHYTAMEAAFDTFEVPKSWTEKMGEQPA